MAETLRHFATLKIGEVREHLDAAQNALALGDAAEFVLQIDYARIDVDLIFRLSTDTHPSPLDREIGD